LANVEKNERELRSPDNRPGVVSINAPVAVVADGPPIDSLYCGIGVPSPTLPSETEMEELPTVDVPVNTGTVPEDPEPVTVCAAALKENAATQIASLLIFILIPLLAFRKPMFHSHITEVSPIPRLLRLLNQMKPMLFPRQLQSSGCGPYLSLRSPSLMK